jgi:hypothetical protein
LFITINILFMVFVRPYRCLQCKMEQMNLDSDKKEGNSVKLAMLSFEEVLEQKMKLKQKEQAASERRASTNSDAMSKWKKAGSQVKTTNILRSKSRKWWEEDAYVSWHVRLRRKLGRWCMSCLKCQCFNGCGTLCCSKKDELQGWENCYHLSNTDQMEGGLLGIQLLMVGFGIAMLFVGRMEGNDPNETLTDDKFTVADVVTVLLILALAVPLVWSIRITLAARKAYKSEKKDVGNASIKGNGFCSRMAKKLSR